MSFEILNADVAILVTESGSHGISEPDLVVGDNPYTFIKHNKYMIVASKPGHSVSIQVDVWGIMGGDKHHVAVPWDEASVNIGIMNEAEEAVKLSLHKDVRTIEHNTFDRLAKLQSISVADANTQYASIDSILYQGDILIRCPRVQQKYRRIARALY